MEYSNLPPNTLNVAYIEQCSTIYGPGNRFVLWVQGCKIRCKECWNWDMWSFDIKKLYHIDEILAMIKEEKEIDGITILGGEPLHQSKALLQLVKQIKKIGLSVMLYTGYELWQITDKDSLELVKLSDIVLSGPYIEKLRSVYLKWRGSSNQQIIINNPKYSYILDEVNHQQNEVEIHISADGSIKILGYPEKEIIDLVKEVVKDG